MGGFMKKVFTRFTFLTVKITFAAFLLSGCSGGNSNSNVTSDVKNDGPVNSDAVLFSIPDDKPVITAAATAIAKKDVSLFNSEFLSKSTGGIDSIPADKATAISDALKNAKLISEDGVGMKTWEMTLNGEKIIFKTILEEGKWKLI